MAIPQTFEQWKACIVNDCKIQLTKDFACQRLEVYNNTNSAETKKFVLVYGNEHLSRIVHWLKQIAYE